MRTENSQNYSLIAAMLEDKKRPVILFRVRFYLAKNKAKDWWILSPPWFAQPPSKHKERLCFLSESIRWVMLPKRNTLDTWECFNFAFDMHLWHNSNWLRTCKPLIHNSLLGKGKFFFFFFIWVNEIGAFEHKTVKSTLIYHMNYLSN